MGSCRPAQDLKNILTEVQKLNAEPDRFKKTHNDFAVRTTNEIDELFAKVDARGRPGRKQACSAKAALSQW
ncbi:MAG: hypothetical protein PHU71_06460 [Candidatus Gracilibacteria bacterium]|nr:hypothetical protein [Candidatus Gracilibacteria bacterium]